MFELAALILLAALPPSDVPFHTELQKCPYLEVMPVPNELTEIREASLPFSHRGDDYGERRFGFTIMPGECLKLHFESIGKMSMQVGLAMPPAGHPMLSPIKIASNLPMPMRMREISIPNKTQEPQQVVYLITGLRMSNYKVTITRAKA